ncbi:MAG: hypothetical protein KZQ65_11905, partial [Candidatus Thiodiazotropha sp. (ex Gloverina cf. vestifex)]|nr:hypothetical protein [Candidatus Thiodiazotropha sp. (ex Gloverina cf. vestifex)]
DSTAFRMRSLYVLHRSLTVTITAIQPRLRLLGTNRLGFHPSMAISERLATIKTCQSESLNFSCLLAHLPLTCSKFSIREQSRFTQSVSNQNSSSSCAYSRSARKRLQDCLTYRHAGISPSTTSMAY